MSIRAYITRERHIWVDEVNRTYYDNNDGENLVKYTHTDLEYCFNVWHQNQLFDLIIAYGGEDYTNRDCVGTVEIGAEDFEELYKETINVGGEDRDSLDIMKKYFDNESSWLTLTCY